MTPRLRSGHAPRLGSGQASRTRPEHDQQAATLYDRVLAAAAAAHDDMRRQDVAPIVAAAAAIADAVRNGGKVLLFGNGGSTADAQHRAAELVGQPGGRADIHVNVPVADTARAQEVHRMLLHILCELMNLTWLEAQGSYDRAPAPEAA